MTVSTSHFQRCTDVMIFFFESFEQPQVIVRGAQVDLACKSNLNSAKSPSATASLRWQWSLADGRCGWCCTLFYFRSL